MSPFRHECYALITFAIHQGVIASGLAALYSATKNTTLLDQAEITLDATISLLTDDDILKESCDDALSGGSVGVKRYRPVTSSINEAMNPGL